MKKNHSFTDDDYDEHIYDSILDFNQTHSKNDNYRACTSFISNDFRSSTNDANSSDTNANSWQQYWDW